MQLALSNTAIRSRYVVSVRLAALLCLVMVAVGVRMYHLEQPPLAFHATRQYRSLLLAREYYYEAEGSIPAWQRDVAAVSAQRQGIIEPPLLEHIVAFGYRILDGEALWLPKLLSSLFWLVGGVFVYRIAVRLSGPEAAVVSTGVYLLLPFGVVASRSFQPDPLMIMLILASLEAMLAHSERPTNARFALVCSLSAAAVLVKPVALFVLVCVFFALGVSRRPLRVPEFLRRLGVFLAIVVLPTLGVYAYALVMQTSIIASQAEKTLVPELLLSSFFWESWLRNVVNVVGLPLAFAGLLGTFVLRERMSKAFMLGLWLGYATFCLTIDYNVAAHDYYQLQLVPIVALGIAPVAGVGLAAIHRWSPRAEVRSAIWLAVPAAALLLGARGLARVANPDLSNEPAIAEEIGAKVQHSTRTVYLSADYGVPLEYHGLLSGAAWPLASDIEWERLVGNPQLAADERFNTWFAPARPEYFIVLDLRELDQQPDLRQFLTSHYPFVVQEPEYWIFDLRHPRAADCCRASSVSRVDTHS